MKKVLLVFLIMICLSGCDKPLKNYDEIKEDILKNIESISLKSDHISDYDYSRNKYFKNILKHGYFAIDILEELFYSGQLNEVGEYVAAFAIQEITDCNVFKNYGLCWETPDEFFEIWKSNNCSYKEIYFENNMDDLLLKYKDFSTVLNECKMNLPIFKNMIPQGITVMKDYILITAYDSDQQSNSSCYVLQKNGEIVKIVTLDTNSHVGSISYDEVNDLIFIPGNSGKLNVYRGIDFLEKLEVKSKWKIDNLSAGLLNYKNQNKTEIAYLNVYDGFLYIGSFSVFQNGVVKKFQIVVEDDSIDIEFINSFKVPNKVQGITFYRSYDREYMFLSRSYGRHNASYLNVYEYDPKISDYSSYDNISISLKFPPMLEQISMQGELYSIFESNAKKYDNCLEKISSVCILNEEKILDLFLKEKEKREEALEKKEKNKKEIKDKKNDNIKKRP